MRRGDYAIISEARLLRAAPGVRASRRSRGGRLRRVVACAATIAGPSVADAAASRARTNECSSHARYGGGGGDCGGKRGARQECRTHPGPGAAQHRPEPRVRAACERGARRCALARRVKRAAGPAAAAAADTTSRGRHSVPRRIYKEQQTVKVLSREIEEMEVRDGAAADCAGGASDAHCRLPWTTACST